MFDIFKREVKIYLNRLKEIRMSKGITQKWLSEKSGISRQRISQIEHDKSASVNSKTLRALADALGVKITDLLLP